MKNKNYIFGIRAVIEAVKSDKELDKVFIKKGIKSDLLHELLSLIKQLNIPFQIVPVQKLERIT